MQNPNSTKESREVAIKILESSFKLGSWMRENYDKAFMPDENGVVCITGSQFKVLYLVKHANVTAIPELVKYLCLSESTVSTAISKLTRMNYLTKMKYDNEKDGRKVSFYITTEGEDALKLAYTKLMKLFKEYYNSLDENMKDIFYENILKLYKVISSLK